MLDDIKVYRNMLRVNKHRLDDELEIQSETLERITSVVARLNSRQLELKQELAKVEGRLTLEAKEDNAKATVAEVTAIVQRDKEYKEAWQKFQLARAEHEEWEGLAKAWSNRGKDIKTLADLYASQYWQLDSHHKTDRQVRRDDDPRARVEAARASAQPAIEVKPRRRSLIG